MRYIIKTQSGISGLCNLGDGPTEKAAWEDAFGPKPWTDYQKKQAKKAWCVEEEVVCKCGARQLDSGCYTSEPCDDCFPVDYSGH